MSSWSGTEMTMEQEDRFFSKLQSKENSMLNSSSRVYYYGGAAVPFVWESQPGTPKNNLLSDSSNPNCLPPLTPPPSYRTITTPLETPKRKSVSAHRGRRRESQSTTSFSSSSTNSSSFSPSFSSPSLVTEKGNYISCSRSPVSLVKDEDDEEMDSRITGLCFGSKQRDMIKERKRGFGFSLAITKKALVSCFTSHGSDRRSGL